MPTDGVDVKGVPSAVGGVVEEQSAHPSRLQLVRAVAVDQVGVELAAVGATVAVVAELVVHDVQLGHTLGRARYLAGKGRSACQAGSCK